MLPEARRNRLRRRWDVARKKAAGGNSFLSAATVSVREVTHSSELRKAPGIAGRRRRSNAGGWNGWKEEE